MSVNQELVSFLNIAKRSQSLRYGQSYLDAKNSAKIKLIILVKSASSNTQKLVHNYAKHYELTVLELDENEISPFVTPMNIKVIAVLNLHIARKLLNLRKEGKIDEKY